MFWCLHAHVVDFVHAREDLVLRDIVRCLYRKTALVAAFDDNSGSHCSLRMDDLLSCIMIAYCTGIAGDGEDFLSLQLHCDLAAHRAADTCKISRFHCGLSAAFIPRPGMKSVLFDLDRDSLKIRLCGQNLLLQNDLLHFAGSHDLLLIVHDPLIIEINRYIGILEDAAHTEADCE